MVSELFDEARWAEVPGFDLTDITYHRAVDQGTVRIAFDRPEVRNAFRPGTVDELYRVLRDEMRDYYPADRPVVERFFRPARLAAE